MIHCRLLNERKLNRLRKFDYSLSGYYFITVCSKLMVKCFGEIKERRMVLNEYGEIVKRCWEEIPEHFSNVFLDEYVIMPNHVHGIIVIHNRNNNNNVGDADLRPLQIQKTNYRYRTKMSLSKILHGFKSSVTRIINNHEIQWQRSFYDHIIRNEKSLHKIREYIRFNPLNRETGDTKHHIENIFN